MTQKKRQDRIDSIFAKVVALPSAEQKIFLDRECKPSEDEIRREVEMLLANSGSTNTNDRSSVDQVTGQQDSPTKETIDTDTRGNHAQHARSDRNMLVAVLALQMDFVTHEELFDGMQRWITKKSEPIEELLATQGCLDKETKQLLVALVDKHLAQHDHDAEQSLKSLHALGATKIELHDLADEDVDRSLAIMSNDSNEKSVGTDPTLTMAGLPAEGERYSVLRPHAMGGLGQVSVAMDHELKREVALKEIQSKFAQDAECRSRFILEAEVTGGLEHPGIVPVYGLGTYADGRPFYAMRFIKGDSLKQAADRFHGTNGQPTKPDFQSLEFRRLLGRFVDVCNAIEYAHTRGVLHRDLKPGNIMLGKYGETLVVDWGLAKLVDREDLDSLGDESTIHVSSGSGSAPTQLGAALGTPSYMSPEQAAGKHDKLGAASDIYSLGATLYYVLVGNPPFENEDIGRLLQSVRDGEFPSPSDINSSVPKELSAICERAMATDPNSRFTLPSQLADEIERYLADEPVASYRQPLAARTARWIRKNQSQVAALLVVTIVSLAALLIVLSVISSSNRSLFNANKEITDQNMELQRAYSELESSNSKLNQALADIEIEKENAIEQRDASVSFNEFIRNDLLGQASPYMEPNRSLTVREVLDRVAETVHDDYHKQPLVEAAISEAIGSAYSDLGEEGQSEKFLTRAKDIRFEHLGPKHPETLKANSSLAKHYFWFGQYKKSEVLYRETYAHQRLVLGDSHRDTLTSMIFFGWSLMYQRHYRRAEEILTDAIQLCRSHLGDEDPDTLIALQGLAEIASIRGDQSAESQLREVSRLRTTILGDWHPYTLYSRGALADFYSHGSRYDLARSLLANVHKRLTETMGEDHPYAIKALCRLGTEMSYTSDFDSADATLLRALKLSRSIEDASNVPECALTLANFYHLSGRETDAIRHFELALEESQKQFGPVHRNTLRIKLEMAAFYSANDFPVHAEELYLEALNSYRQHYGVEESDTLDCMESTAVFLMKSESYPKAEDLLKELLDWRIQLLGESHPDSLRTMVHMANCRSRRQDEPAGRDDFDNAYSIAVEEFGQDNRTVRTLLLERAYCLYDLQSYENARQLFEQALESHERLLNEPDFETSRILHFLALCLSQQDRHEDAEKYLRSAYEIRSEQMGVQHPIAIDLMGHLVLQYLANGEYDEARSLVMKAQSASHPWQVSSYFYAALELEQSASEHLLTENFPDAENYFRILLEIQRLHVKDSLTTLKTQCLIGHTLTRQKEFESAETLLVETYEELKRSLPDPTVDELELLNLTGQLIVDLYSDWDMPIEVDRWNEKLRRDLQTDTLNPSTM